MHSARILAPLLLLTACGAAPKPPPAPVKTPVATPAPAGPALHVVVDSTCKRFAARPLEDAMILSWSDEEGAALARLTDDGMEALPRPKGRRVHPGVAAVTDVAGTTSHAFWIAYGDPDCASRSSALRFDGNGWKPAFGLGDADSVSALAAYPGGALAIHGCVTGCDGPSAPPSCPRAVLWSDGVSPPPPPLGAGGFRIGHVAALPNGNVYAVGSSCGDTPCGKSILRWWKPGGTVSSLTFPSTSGVESILARSPAEVVVAQGPAVQVFDGAKMSVVTTLPDDVTALVDRGDDGYFIVSKSKIVSVSRDGAVSDATPPGKDHHALVAAAATRSDAAWAIVDEDVYRRDGKSWLPVPLDRALRPHTIFVRAPDDVWVVATSAEHHEVLLSTKKPAKTLHCP